MTKPDLLFVYGTLLGSERSPLRNMLRKHAELIGKGRAAARLFDLGEYPGATPTSGALHSLLGELYRIDPERLDEVLQALDEYEEFDPADKKNSLFVRRITDVRTKENEKVKAWIYWYNRPIKNKDVLRHGNYARRDLHVVPHDKGWAIKISGKEHVSKVLPTLQAAIDQAKVLAGKSGPSLIIHGRDGRIRERRNLKPSLKR